ncbi:hypothetical protein PAF17_04845 [Paracoccus sp. Z330]|uniref:MFS transporter n=1 Tax=Paracoccus onchidii TaxID=3017813 RepID=A0ABT4ZBU5_9RHOB|nr:hypothetical protein [Paracoccus onchidii]MDB6176833.1 hypothetical protein [Paracoccus onchidii]
MRRDAFLVHATSVVIFIGSNLAFLSRPTGFSPVGLAGLAPRFGLFPLPDSERITAPISLAQLYLHPVNLVLWSLLAALWLMLLLDLIGQWQDPSESQRIADRPAPPVALPFSSALILGAIWPWLIQPSPWLAATIAAAAAALAFAATQSGRDQARPALDFAAGWALVTCGAILCHAVAITLDMSASRANILGILIATGAGMSAQIHMGRRLALSVAVVWGFCAIAATTMGFDPITAIAAILGITAMTAVLIRAAS